MGSDLTPFLAFGGAVVAAIVACFGSVRVASARVKVDLGAQVASGVDNLLKTLQEERGQLAEIVRRQREEIATYDRVALEAETALRKQRRRIGVLEDRLTDAQISIPPE